MTEYVLATEPDDVERRRMELLFAYHGRHTISMLEEAGVSRGWRCLEVGAGGGDITQWLAGHVGPDGSVVAVDLETRWVESIADARVEVRRGDFTQLDLGRAEFDLVVAQMVLLHLPDPGEACLRFLELARPGGQVVVHDADFTPVALPGATESEASGLSVMPDVMRAGGVDLALGPRIADLLQAAGATVEQVQELPCNGADDERIAAEISAITIERFRDRAQAPGDVIDAALAALGDSERSLIGPTRWVVRARRPGDQPT